MSQFFSIHPDNPQQRLVRQAAEILRKDGVIVYPTDSCYAFGCRLDSKKASDRIRDIRRFDKHHHFTVMCADLADIANYAKVDNAVYRMLKTLTPGPYTFILQGSRELPRRIVHEKRKTIGMRVPENNVAHALLAEMGEPILSCTMQLPGEEFPHSDPYEMRDVLEHQVDLIIDGGWCGMEPSSVVDLSGDNPDVIRRGLGDVSLFE